MDRPHPQVIAEPDAQNGVRYGNANSHNRTHQDEHIDGDAGRSQDAFDADQSSRCDHHYDEGIDPRLKTDNEDRLDQEDRQQQTKGAQAEGFFDHLIFPAQKDFRARWRIFLYVCGDRLDLTSEASKFPPFTRVATSITGSMVC